MRTLPALLALGLLATTALAQLVPFDLRVESRPDPLGIDSPNPRFSWKLRGEGRGLSQSAYQILIASSRETLDQADLWDSGKVAADQTINVRYAGKPLSSSQRCWWKVRAWDQAGQPSPWSAPASFVTGILPPQDWQAKWIMRAPAPAPESLPLFRKLIDIDKPVKQAVVHVCGLGHYELFLDGGKVGNRFLDPAWSVYEKTVYYGTYDPTAQLAPGKHAIGVMLGKGFYNTQGDRRIHGVNAKRPLKLILQLELTFADGSRRTVVSDSSWRSTPGPITHSAILGGEDYDARKLPPDWAKAPFDDSAWEAAVETQAPGGALRAGESPPMIALDVFKPARIDEPKPGVFVYDFGQNASAIPRLTVRGKPGQAVRLIPAEQRAGSAPRKNDGRGLVNQAGVGRPNYFQYTIATENSEIWSPQFTYSGFQYLQVEGAVPAGTTPPAGSDPPIIEELVSVHVRSASAAAGSFECSDERFNRIDRMIDWAVRSNLAHVLTDCPHREKLGWLEVSYLMGPSIAGRYDIHDLYAKVTRDIADSQKPDGQVPTVAPAYPAFSGSFAYTPEWGAAAVIVPWQIYQWYDDRELLDARFNSMTAFVEYMEKTSKDLVPAPGLGDWYDYGHGGRMGPSRFTPIDLTAMATFHRCARTVADAAMVLEKKEAQQRYDELARRIAEAFNKRFFDGIDQYKNTGSPQAANAMALVTGVVPRDKRGAVFERIIEDLRKRNSQQTAGDIAFWYLIQALAEEGRSDVLFEIADRRDIGSYGYILDNGWTSMPEAWDADTGASMNHCMLGHIQEWLFGWVGGLRPDPSAPGFKRFIVDPHPVGKLTSAKVSYESVRGPIQVSWQRTATAFELKVTVPPNTSAMVHVPATSAQRVLEGNAPASKAAGVRFVRIDPPRGKDSARAVFEVGSGSYVFSVKVRE